MTTPMHLEPIPESRRELCGSGIWTGFWNRFLIVVAPWIMSLAGVAMILDVRIASGAGPGPAETATAVPTQTGPTGWSNRRIARTAAFAVAAADNSGTLALGGNAFYRLTFDAPANYPASFAVAVLNEDRGRAKFVVLSGNESFYLWPGQSIVVFNQNNIWRTMGRAKWLLPTGPVTIHTDFVHGSDEYGKADGLETGTGALKSVNHGLDFANDQFCWNPDSDVPGAGVQTRVTVRMRRAARIRRECIMPCTVFEAGRAAMRWKST